MSIYADRADDTPELTELTVEQMFRGLPPVGLEEPLHGVAADGLHGLRLPQAMLDAIRHYS